MKTYNELYINTRNTLKRSGIEAYALEARVLVASAAGKTVQQLLRDLNLYTTAPVEALVEEYTARRLKGEPVAYITGDWEFYGLPMKVTKDVLIPRPDTELLVDLVKAALTGYKMDARILDLCCGSGCITCAVGHELPATKLVAVDLSASALEICRVNVSLNRLTTRVICMQADATTSPPLGIGSFDVIVSNPPYIATEEIRSLDRSVKDYEPIWALDGGTDGLRFYKAIIKYWKTLLRPEGLLIFEVGEGQAEAVSNMLAAAGFSSTSIHEDARGVERAVVGRM